MYLILVIFKAVNYARYKYKYRNKFIFIYKEEEDEMKQEDPPLERPTTCMTPNI